MKLCNSRCCWRIWLIRKEKLNKVREGEEITKRQEKERKREEEEKRERDKRGAGNDVSVLTDDELFV